MSAEPMSADPMGADPAGDSAGGPGDEELLRHVADKLAERHPQASRAELDRIVREEFDALSGRPVQAYLSILTERAARKRLKRAAGSDE